MKKGINNKDKWIKHYMNAYLIVKKKFLRKGIRGVHVKYN
jgi:hypothetical protein